MSGDLRAAVEAALGVLRDLELAGEVYVETARQTKVVVSGEAVESIEERREEGLALRVFPVDRVGFSYTTDLTAGGIADAARLARELAAHCGADSAWRLPPLEEAPPLPFPNEVAPDGADAFRGTPIAIEMERAAKEVDPRIGRTRQAVFAEYRGEVRIANTAGLAAGHRYSRAVASIEVTAAEAGTSQFGDHIAFALDPAGLDAASVGREAARKALAKLGASPAPTGTVRAVLDRDVVSGLLAALSAAFSARRVLKGTSVLAGLQGERVGSDAVSLVDDPRLPGGYGSAPFDGEGLPTRRVALVEDGRLRSYLCDTFAAAKLDRRLGGNTVRGSFATPPRIAPRNLLLEPGPDPVEALIERAGEGLWIGEVLGLHTVDATTGDFSLGGYGRRIDRGRLGAAVDRIAFSGNILDLLRSVEAVGSDLRLVPQGGGAPSVLVSELCVAGT